MSASIFAWLLSSTLQVFWTEAHNLRRLRLPSRRAQVRKHPQCLLWCHRSPPWKALQAFVRVICHSRASCYVDFAQLYSMVFLFCSCRSSGFREPTSLPTFTGFLWRSCSSCGQIVFHLVIIGFQSFCSSHCRWLASRIILWQDSAKLWEPNVVVLHSLKFEASNALRCQGHLLKKKPRIGDNTWDWKYLHVLTCGGCSNCWTGSKYTLYPEIWKKAGSLNTYVVVSKYCICLREM